jgi:pyruvate dehydrogenase E1 component alpha subunit
VARRACAYGIPGYEVNGDDILEVRKTVSLAVEQAREGKGPSIVENKTYRFRGHFEGDPQKYRTKNEIEDFMKNHDPIELFRAVLAGEGILSPKGDKDIRDEVAAMIEDAARYGQQEQLPQPEEALDDLFVNP